MVIQMEYDMCKGLLKSNIIQLNDCCATHIHFFRAWRHGANFEGRNAIYLIFFYHTCFSKFQYSYGYPRIQQSGDPQGWVGLISFSQKGKLLVYIRSEYTSTPNIFPASSKMYISPDHISSEGR